MVGGTSGEATADVGAGPCARPASGPNYIGGTRRAGAGDPRPRARLVGRRRAQGNSDPPAARPLELPLLSAAPRTARFSRRARVRSPRRASAAAGATGTAAG